VNTFNFVFEVEEVGVVGRVKSEQAGADFGCNRAWACWLGGNRLKPDM
jgi:hypothetical protein